MRPSSLNPGLMADYQNKAMTPAEMESALIHEAFHQEVYKEHMALEQTKAEFEELLPEPAGGYRANLITFGIRAHVLGLDKRHDFRRMLAIEKAYFGINRMTFAAARQTGKTEQATDNIRTFMGNWLNYIDQAVSTKGA